MDLTIELALAYILTFAGVPYKWGGNMPSDAIDCSGLVVEYLKAAGKLPRGTDYSAGMLWDKFHRFSQTKLPRRGCLVFYKNKQTDKINHVEIMMSDKVTFGANGGSRNTKTLKDAVERNAFVKQRLIDKRRKIAGYLDPMLMEDAQ